MRRSNGLKLGIFSLLIAAPLFSNVQPAVDSLFYRGVQTYQSGRYEEALQTFEFLDRVYSRHQRITGSLLMQGKALYKMQKYQRAIESYEEILNDYPKSAYLDDALYGVAEAQYKRGYPVLAVSRLLEIFDRSEDARLIQKSVKLSSDIMDYKLDLDEVRTLLNMVQGERGRSAVVLKLAQREMDAKHFVAAKKVLTDYSQAYPSSPYLFQVQQMLNRVEALGKSSIKLGVILPLTGSLADAGKQMLIGIQYAVNEHNDAEPTRVEIIVRDSQSSVLQSVKMAQDLCEKEHVLAIIGELESDKTAAIAAVAQANKTVLLAPTASETGITSIGDYIFQFNSTFESRGRALAEYAISGQGLRRFAILYPADSYGQAMRDAFVQTVTTMGGEIVIEKHYFGGTENLNAQFLAIREQGIKRMLADSVLRIVPKRELPLYSRQGGEGVIYVHQRIPGLVDSTDLAVTSMDGIFIPCYHEDLQYVIPQFARYNIKARIIGGIPWNDMDMWEEHRRFIDPDVFDGAVFLSDFYEDSRNIKYNDFKNTFRTKTKQNPGKLTVFGYDAIKLLMAQVQEGIPDQAKLRDSLLHMTPCQGVRGDIVFDSSRVNPELHILQYKNGMISLIR